MLSADQTRIIATAKRRISPNIKDSPSGNPIDNNINEKKILNCIKTPVNNVISNIDMITPKSTENSQKLSTINSSSGRRISNLPKYGLTKK